MIGKKQKGNRRAWQTAYSPNAEEMGERPGRGTGLVPPKRRRWGKRLGNGTGLVPPKM